jgi:hypothetical protein
MATASTSTPMTIHLYSGLGPELPGSLLRSMRRLSRAFWSKAMDAFAGLESGAF